MDDVSSDLVLNIVLFRGLGSILGFREYGPEK